MHLSYRKLPSKTYNTQQLITSLIDTIKKVSVERMVIFYYVDNKDCIKLCYALSFGIIIVTYNWLIYVLSKGLIEKVTWKGLKMVKKGLKRG